MYRCGLYSAINCLSQMIRRYGIVGHNASWRQIKHHDAASLQAAWFDWAEHEVTKRLVSLIYGYVTGAYSSVQRHHVITCARLLPSHLLWHPCAILRVRVRPQLTDGLRHLVCSDSRRMVGDPASSKCIRLARTPSARLSHAEGPSGISRLPPSRFTHRKGPH